MELTPGCGPRTICLITPTANGFVKPNYHRTVLRWGAFYMLHEKSQEDVRTVVEAVSQAENVEPGSAAQKIRDFYNSYMDTETATERSVEAIRSELDMIADIESRDDLFRVIGKLGRYGVDSPIGGMIYSDLKAPDTAVVYLAESGITLPDRDYYLKDDEQFVKGRELFLAYATRLFDLAGIEDGANKAEALLALERSWPMRTGPGKTTGTRSRATTR